MENNIKRRGMKEIRAYAKQRPKVFTVYVILRLLVVAVLVRSAMLKEYESMFVCLLVLVLFMLPSFLERKLKIELPDTLEIIILVFIFAVVFSLFGYFYVKHEGRGKLVSSLVPRVAKGEDEE